MNIETIKLRKCPICGKEIIIRNICGVYYTYCQSCGMRSGDYKTKQDLLKSWNEAKTQTGHWIYHNDWNNDGCCPYECSECGMGSDLDSKYCPRCGAKMYGVCKI